jgi:glycosyltransferase involved in cell wall biosynthesis
MRVALYHPWVYLRGGAERTLLELVSRSRHNWTVFTNHYAPDDTFPEFRQVPCVELTKVSVKRNLSAVALACMRLLTTQPDWAGYDALMISCEGIGNLMALHSGGLPTFCLCHTPLKIAHDPWTRERWLTVGQPAAVTRAGVRLYAVADRMMWQRYRRIFCVSHEVQRRVLQARLAQPDRTEVVYPGVNAEGLTPSGRREPFFLMAGRIMWSKNLELGLRAFLEWKSHLPAGDALTHFRLVVAGMVDAKSHHYLADLKRLAAGRDDIEFVLTPSDGVLFDLYNRCHSLLFTPLNEDWGIVPLEAMAHGKPVIAVHRGGPAESVVHRETGFLCPPVPTAFAQAMETILLDDGRYREMSERARDRALQFTWPAFVDRIDDSLQRLSAPGWRPAGMRRSWGIVR